MVSQILAWVLLLVTIPLLPFPVGNDTEGNSPRRHQEHKERLCALCVFVVKSVSESTQNVITASGGGGKVESIGAFTEQSASESVRNALEPKGYRAMLGDGSVVCDIWLRKGAPVQAQPSESGALYQFAASALVGVVSFPKASVDCRWQTIRPGAYTLRYALLPNDANHLGAAPSRDFLLLTPVDADRDANAQFKFEELTKMSAKASGTNHPASLPLVSTEGQKDFPAVVEDEQKQAVFVAKLKTGSGADLPVALVVKAVPAQ